MRAIRAIRTAIGTLGIAALLALCVVALERGWADIVSFQGRSAIRTWDKQRLVPAADAWGLGHERLQHARILDAANPAIAEDIARLYELRAIANPATGPAANADFRLALEYLRASARARPGSPYTWANIALVKSRLGQRDEEFLRAIRQAAAFGPWEPEVQLLVAEIGLREWDRLPEAARTSVRSAIARGLKRQDEKLFDFALRFSRLDVLCATPGVHRARRALRCI